MAVSTSLCRSIVAALTVLSFSIRFAPRRQQQQQQQQQQHHQQQRRGTDGSLLFDPFCSHDDNSNSNNSNSNTTNNNNDNDNDNDDNDSGGSDDDRSESTRADPAQRRNPTPNNPPALAPAPSSLAPRQRKLVVGGSDAPLHRYPYFVSLSDSVNGTHKCAGSLVAPDVVMTAAHCDPRANHARVGTYYTQTRSSGSGNGSGNGSGSDNDSGDEWVEFRNIVGKHPHPLSEEGVSFSHDALLLQLDRSVTTHRYVRINTDPGVPGHGDRNGNGVGDRNGNRDRNNDDDDDGGNDHHGFTILGIGSTKFTKFGSSSRPRVLQEAGLSFVPNRVCRRSEDPEVEDNYRDLISDDMFCAFEENRDACQGALLVLCW
eukprot:CAMPEP_0172378236 /NCGR_PEP_ID=MMETSP1060-20121228/69316_1 /TAXON_ID=37318 /ORGANISM="Pseudo-nitzschia pungens, Strain cf. cingulata" /LENGTH=372 /DNA_ID=CAMNT_0013105953 /DNA_START=264 /DNA_END=1381 /DNA_ORIENTATION=-